MNKLRKPVFYRKRSNIQKRPFQLLEILIAIFLVIVCAIPLVQTYVGMHLEQKDQNRLADANQIVEEVHAKILEDLYKKKIGFQQMEDPQEREIDDESLITKAKKLNFKVTYNFERVLPRKLRADTAKVLMHLNIKLTRLDDPKKSTTIRYSLYAALSKPSN